VNAASASTGSPIARYSYEMAEGMITNDAAPADRSDLARLTALLNALPAAAALFRRDGTLYAVNEQGRDCFVVDPLAPLPSQRWSVVLFPLGDIATELMRGVVAGGAATTRAMTMGRDGRSVLVRTAPFEDDLVLLTVIDAVDREPHRSVTDRSDRELSAVLGLTPAAVRFVDVSGQIVQANDVATRDHPSRCPTSVRELWELDAPHDVATNRPLSFLDAPAMRALAGHTTRGQLIDVRRLGAPRVIEAYAAPVWNDQQEITGVVLIDGDVTEREQLRRQLRDDEKRELQRQAQVSLEQEPLEPLVEARSRALMAAVGQLAAGVIHDVNNALNPIMAAAYLLRHYAESPDAVRDYADRIQKAAETGAAMASRVGRFIRQEPVHVGGDEPLDLSVLTNEVLDLTEPMRLSRSRERGEVVIDRQLGAAVHSRGLPGEVRAALLNLVQNAIDAMPTGGTLTLRTFVEGADACVAVRDTGVGMSADVRERAFEPFFTTKGAKGSGLGLAEVYGIARRHRGTAIISSVPERGTEVTLRLPFHGDAPPNTVAEIVAPPAIVPRHILVVEDHDDGREFLRRILRADGHTVDAVSTCADARDRLAADRPVPYDVILTDVGLPDGSGWDLVQHVRTGYPSVRIGVITGWEANDDPGSTAGAEFVMRKPLRAAELQAHIARRTTPASTTEP
jgi:signal transduction histidine kinase/ActR/RegA family two-component response regulator